MKKITGNKRISIRAITVGSVFAFVVLCVVPVAMGAVSGACSSCHTMHDSQSGVEYDRANVGDNGPQGKLLVDTCVGCHTGTNDANATRPFVMANAEPTLWDETLGGGSFWWVADVGGNTDSKGHNVNGVSGVDFSTTPPGWSTDADYHTNVDRSTVAWGGTQLTCSGLTGCHGTAGGGIQGTHHSSNNTNAGQYADDADPGALGDDYRFLKGIKGWEAGDFGLGGDLAGDDYNIYKGEDRYNSASGTNDLVAKDTMSFLCAECHGQFHSSDGTADTGVADIPTQYGTSEWIRHPIDIALDQVGGTYAASYTTYNPRVPVAYSNIGAVKGNAYTPGNIPQANTGSVTCLSCHLAHGGPYDDLLRWDYANYTTSDVDDAGEGCFQCHGDKDA